MTKSRIIFTTIGSLGDWHPKIAIALEMRKRGHEIAFATHKQYQAKIEALGFDRPSRKWSFCSLRCN
ncbi:MAG: glycosyltransferase [Oscillatoriaceae cyanobacterium Prado104]|jgi:UDP:flavonoid glycosyltransferase YjiC (YdhE family)|nr:glycosyltransferase [Oscillatoriaceae cyanobacterium Prado104]